VVGHSSLLWRKAWALVAGIAVASSQAFDSVVMTWNERCVPWLLVLRSESVNPYRPPPPRPLSLLNIWAWRAGDPFAIPRRASNLCPEFERTSGNLKQMFFWVRSALASSRCHRDTEVREAVSVHCDGSGRS